MEKIEQEDLNMEERILDIKIKCSCEDYKNAMQIAPSKYTSNLYILKYVNYCSLFAIVITFLTFIQYIEKKDYFVPRLLLILYFITIVNIYHYHCYKSQRLPFMKGLSSLLLKHLTKFYKGRSKGEIKRMVIPCEIIFFETYLIKHTPSLEDIIQESPDKVIDLPLSVYSPPIKYSKLKNIKENDNYISFCKNCFIPKAQLNNIEKEQIIYILDILS